MHIQQGYKSGKIFHATRRTAEGKNLRRPQNDLASTPKVPNLYDWATNIEYTLLTSKLKSLSLRLHSHSLIAMLHACRNRLETENLARI